MHTSLKKIKRSLFGGTNYYYITADKNYFIKVCKDREDWISSEFEYLKNYWNKLDIENLQLIEPIYCSKKHLFIVSRYVKGKKLVDILDPKVYFKFGQTLKLFHNKGFSHSHLEVHDVLYNDGIYYMADVPFFNERDQIHDLVSMKLTLNLYRLKRPCQSYIYKQCLKEFFRGYGPLNGERLEEEYLISIKKRYRLYMRRSIFYRIRAILFKFIYKIGLI
jgi:tRNA A-37 threonylcarbamoyl transferase component Bud32